MILSKLATLLFFASFFGIILCLGYLAHKKQSKILSVALVLLPAIIVAIRFQTGSDTENYKDIYDSLNSTSLHDAIMQITSLSFEPFTILSARLSDFIGFGYFFYFLAHSLPTFAASLFVSKKIDPNRWWLLFASIALILLPYSLNIMRQTLAASLFVLLLVLLAKKQKSWLTIVATFILMISCHFSSILLLPVLFIHPLISRKRFESLFFLLFVVIIISLAAFPFIFSFISSNELLPPKYLEAIGVSKFNLFNFDFVIFLALSVFLYITRKFENRYSPEHNQYLSLIILCNLFYAGIGLFSAYIGRMSDYFWPVAVIGIWFLLDRFRDSFRLKGIVYICLIFTYFVASCFILGNNQIVPYGVM